MTTGPVALSNPAGGTQPSTSTFGIPVVTNIEAMLGKPIARWYASVTQSIPTSTTAFTVLSWDQEYDDTQGLLVPTSGVATIPAGWAGRIRVKGKYWTSGSATGSRYVGVMQNGNMLPGTVEGTANPGSGQFSLACEAEDVMVAVGDTISIGAQQSSGAPLLTAVGTYLGSSMAIEWLRS